MVLRPKWKCHNNVSEPLWPHPRHKAAEQAQSHWSTAQRPRPLLHCLSAEGEKLLGLGQDRLYGQWMLQFDNSGSECKREELQWEERRRRRRREKEAEEKREDQQEEVVFKQHSSLGVTRVDSLLWNPEPLKQHSQTHTVHMRVPAR